MKPKRLGRGLKGLIKSSDPETLPPSRKTVPAAAPPPPPTVQPVVPPPAPTPVAELEPAVAPTPEVPPAAPQAGKTPSGVREILVAEVRANPYQPRMHFDEDALQDLQSSIAEHGVLQPVVVRPAATGFELIAGERRLRAVRALGGETIPAIVRRAADEEMQTLALVENLQRVDLNAIEKAKSLKAMMFNFGLTQEQVAEKVGKARTSISNLVRLLELPGVIQDLVSEGHLSGSQARAVLLAQGAEKRIALAQRAVRQGLTVRQIEALAKASRPQSKQESEPDPYVADLERRLREALSTRVSLSPKGQGGTITVGYHDADDLDRLLGIFGAS